MKEEKLSYVKCEKCKNLHTIELSNSRDVFIKNNNKLVEKGICNSPPYSVVNCPVVSCEGVGGRCGYEATWRLWNQPENMNKHQQK